jgi:purine-binding chemotaxis protein CheW
MKTSKTDWTRANQVVVIRVEEKKEENTNLFFLFTVSQVEEVLPDITLTGIPFAPEFIQGMCRWRRQLLPVIDLKKRFGLTEASQTLSERYVVVRAGSKSSADDKQLVRCVFRVPDSIKVIEATDQSVHVSPEKFGVKPSLVRGAYRQGDDFFVVPDVASILQNEQKIDIL